MRNLKIIWLLQKRILTSLLFLFLIQLLHAGGYYFSDFNKYVVSPFMKKYTNGNSITVQQNYVRMYYNQINYDTYLNRENKGPELEQESLKLVSSGWLAFEMYLPASQFPRNHSQGIGQLFQSGASNTWAGMLSIVDSNLVIAHRAYSGTPDETNIGKPMHDRWISIIINFKVSKNNTGFVKVWYNNLLENSPTFNHSDINFGFGDWIDTETQDSLKGTSITAACGMYCYDAPNYIGVAGTRVLYMDNLTMSDGSSTSFDDIKSRFTRIPKLKGNFSIIAVNSKKAVQVSEESNFEGALVGQMNYNGNANQRWIITNTSDFNYKILNQNSGMALGVKDNSTDNGAKIEQQIITESDTVQIWAIMINDDGTYRIIDKHSGKALTVTGLSVADNTTLEIRPYSGANNQKFIFTDVTNIALPSGVRNVFDNWDVECYPTLVDNEFNILNPQYKNLKIQLYNAHGDKLLEKTTSDMEYKLKMSEYSQGLYFVIYNNGIKAISKKIIKI